MNKSNIKIMLSAATIIAILNVNGLANASGELKFVGCLEDKMSQGDACKNMCGSAYPGGSNGFATGPNNKLCPDPAKPIACLCNVKKIETKTEEKK